MSAVDILMAIKDMGGRATIKDIHRVILMSESRLRIKLNTMYELGLLEITARGKEFVYVLTRDGYDILKKFGK